MNAKILVVDDLEANVLLERLLQGEGYTAVESTTNPFKVLELYRYKRYDIILLDIEMPGMDGSQVLNGLRKIGTGDDPPVLVITASSDHKQCALDSGAKDFVSKPFELVEVLTRVHNIFEVRLPQNRKMKWVHFPLISAENPSRSIAYGADEGWIGV